MSAPFDESTQKGIPVADIQLTHPHALGKHVAQQKAAQALAKVKAQTGLDGTWKDDVFTAAKPVKGTLSVTDTEVRVQIDLGFALRLLKTTIEKELKRELRAALG